MIYCIYKASEQVEIITKYKKDDHIPSNIRIKSKGYNMGDEFK